MFRFSGIWNIPGIFQKNTTSKIFYFWNMEYSKEKLLQPKELLFGVWNIQKEGFNSRE